MSKGPRIVAPGLPHHVYLRGNNRRRLFSSNADRLRWLGCLRVGLDAGDCQLHQLTLMTNHVHLIVTPAERPGLAVMFKRSNQRYAQIRNQSLGATGKLFEERYRSKVIKDEAQLMATTLYNDANAQQANMIGDPLAHEWSTGPLHAHRPGSRIPAELWTPSLWYLGLGPTPEARGRAYQAHMHSYVAVTRAALIDAGVEYADTHGRPRVLRPDGSSAREIQTRWGKKR